MASIAELIGWDPLHPSPQAALAQLDQLNPDDYPAYAQHARALGTDLRSAFTDALVATTAQEHDQDRSFLERASEFVELNDQVDASTQLLTDLSSFLATFQRDLSAVSGHISELQGRSKTIEARLKARKAVERSLHPFLSSIAISPSLITTIIDTEVNDAWIPAVRELDAKLGAIRGGARVESRRNLDKAAEALRVAASSKILSHLISLSKPYTVSISPSLATLHATLLSLKPLFDFLRRHAARQAHEFQKAYAQTTRWYLETAFRRYIRALEKIRTARAAVPTEPIGSVAGVADALALLNQRKATSPAGRAAETAPTSTSVALDNAQITGPGVILAHMANERSFHPAPEALFRSASLVLADNAAAEHAFLSSFFGQHSTLDLLSPSPSPAPTPAPGAGLRRSATNGSLRSAAAPPSESARTAGAGERDEKMQRAVVDALWKSVMDPALEYTRNFLHALLDPVPPSPIALLSMIRLNESLASVLVTSPSSAPAPSTPFPPCPPLEAHLSSLRLQLLPTFSRVLSLQVDSLRRINGSPAASGGGVGGMLARATGAATSAVKDSVVLVIVGRYCELFGAAVAILAGGDAQGQEDNPAEGQAQQDEEMIFSALLRLRQELDKLLAHQAGKIPSPEQQRAFLRAQYEELLQGLSAGLASHARIQAEVAHYREAARKVA
ncbi:Vacuolar protein sorting-associated protein 52 [Rhodotorula kratochvilovae]